MTGREPDHRLRKANDDRRAQIQVGRLRWRRAPAPGDQPEARTLTIAARAPHATQVLVLVLVRLRGLNHLVSLLSGSQPRLRAACEYNNGHSCDGSAT